MLCAAFLPPNTATTTPKQAILPFLPVNDGRFLAWHCSRTTAQRAVLDVAAVDSWCGLSARRLSVAAGRFEPACDWVFLFIRSFFRLAKHRLWSHTASVRQQPLEGNFPCVSIAWCARLYHDLVDTLTAVFCFFVFFVLTEVQNPPVLAKTKKISFCIQYKKMRGSEQNSPTL